MKNSNKGQMTIVGIMMILMSLVALSGLMPTITEQVNLAKQCVTGPTSALLDLIPLFMVISLLVGITMYMTAHKEPAY